LLELIEGTNPVCATVGTTPYTCRTRGIGVAQVAFGGNLLLLAAQAFRDHVGRPLLFGIVHDDGIVRTFVRTGLAADAELFIYLNDITNISPANRSRRTANQTDWILTMVARSGNEKISNPVPFANEPRDVIVSRGASTYTIIAPRTHVQVNDEDAVPFHQSLIERGVDEF